MQVEQSTQTFHAEGGVLLRNLHPILLERGNLALSSLGSISDQTLAGAVATSTHGSGVTYGSLSSCVTFLDIVIPLPGAPVVRCSKEEDPDLFSSALCGVGAVGIVVGVGMRAERKFKLEEECFSMEFEEFTSRWKEIAESAEHVRCWWFPQVGRVKVSRMNRTTKVFFFPFLPSLFPVKLIRSSSPGYHPSPTRLLQLCRLDPPLSPLPRRRSYHFSHLPSHPSLPRLDYVDSHDAAWSGAMGSVS